MRAFDSFTGGNPSTNQKTCWKPFSRPMNPAYFLTHVPHFWKFNLCSARLDFDCISCSKNSFTFFPYSFATILSTAYFNFIERFTFRCTFSFAVPYKSWIIGLPATAIRSNDSLLTAGRVAPTLRFDFLELYPTIITLCAEGSLHLYIPVTLHPLSPFSLIFTIRLQQVRFCRKFIRLAETINWMIFAEHALCNPFSTLWPARWNATHSCSYESQFYSGEPFNSQENKDWGCTRVEYTSTVYVTSAALLLIPGLRTYELVFLPSYSLVSENLECLKQGLRPPSVTSIRSQTYLRF